jgi:cytochrome c-type biogenesis protein
MPGAELNVLLAMAAGLLSFLSPCVLPLLPSYLSFIAGLSFEELQGTVANPRTRRAILVN